MACAHNCMIRGLNSIYLQAEYVKKLQDIKDFLFFVKSWVDWVSDHHILEEKQMFPGFEKVIEYGSQSSRVNYDAATIRRTIEEMAPSFHRHLSDEINSLLSMQPYNGAALLKVYKYCVAEATKKDKQVVPPMVLGLRDVTFEGGNKWPSLPPMAAWVISYFLACRHSGSWRFLPCDSWGKPRALAFGPGGDNEATMD
ncbi:hypothetical protein N7537_010254 [Penicillium hordei]|uniref:Hemerythrin-like domain-containing protein n=1 Tax=Penicillium hordei TaxID=40994 RepID=A0AAD6DV15_9EURO|nr:uncharacterized protein N7537_010254 [Penicillium hordei]KAJ5593350.1 hypothetical protein N7537_010254 [Penicillium hordei]